MKMRKYLTIHSFVGATSSTNVVRTGSGGVGLLGANARAMVNTKVNTFFTPQKRPDKDDDNDNSSKGSAQVEVLDSDEENSTDSDQPKRKKGKTTKEDVLQSRKVQKKANKKAEKDSPAGTHTQIHT
jgi:hypothetical protein